ncbi:MarR family winged helix-turn-helix transcriptional regulator [Thomasclavelia sp.]|uniref:MarR family winged helix-turn-helix transcriptional regulator n=1 Tax=Thomasclavelia sp. TaxID=3025757 RepID=UPI0025E0198F|nr:MarR family transcriptional regulator [Thomasclavelia sp.]
MKTPLYILLFKTFHAQRRKNRENMDQYNMAPGQPKVLRYIAQFPDCKLKDIANGCDLKSATVSKTLNNLEEKGLLTRKIDPQNKRAYQLTMTKEGKEALKKWEIHCQEVEKIALKGFSDAEKEQFSDYFKRMYFNLTGKKIE